MSIKQKVQIEVPVQSLEIGMYVDKLDIPWEDSPFVLQGFFVYDQQDIQVLQDLCNTVFVLAERETWEEKKKVTLSTGKERIRTETQSRITYINKVPAYRELEKASTTYGEARQLVKNILQAVRLGRSFDMQEVRATVTGVVDSILCNPNAMQWLSLIKNKDDYTAEHCLRVCVLAVSLGREMGLLEQELIDLGISGFLHDVGKVKVPDHILNKPGRFTDDELEVMRTHATHGKNILLSLKGVPAIAIDVAHGHHERMDGKGYPRQLAPHQISQFARIVSVVDAYDAITSVRVYKTAMSSLEALRILYDERQVHFDPEVTDLFIRMMGIYPAGHIAELTNGEVGIIIQSRNEHRLLPKLLCVQNNQGHPVKEKVVDLSRKPLDDKGRPLRIKHLHPNGAFGLRLEPYLKKGLRLGEMEE